MARARRFRARTATLRRGCCPPRRTVTLTRSRSLLSTLSPSQGIPILDAQIAIEHAAAFAELPPRVPSLEAFECRPAPCNDVRQRRHPKPFTTCAVPGRHFRQQVVHRKRLRRLRDVYDEKLKTLLLTFLM